MKKVHLYFLIMACMAGAIPTTGQDTLFIDNQFVKKKAGPFIRYFKTAKTISADSTDQVFSRRLAEIRTLHDSHLGIGTDNFWFSLLIKNTSDQESRLILELRQPHLTTVSFFEKTLGGIQNKGTMGMLHPFNSRPVKHRNLLMPIECEPGHSVQVYVLITQENSLDAPFILWNEASFHKHDYDLNLLFGVFFGILIFCSLLALFCFIMVRQKVFFWYFLYVATAGAYLFQEIGAAFQYIYPDIVYIDAPISIQLPVFIFIFLIKFTQAFLNTAVNQKRVHQILNSIAIFYMVMLFLGWVVNDFMRSISLWLLTVISLVMLLGHFLLIYSGIRYIRINFTSALLYLVATGSVILSGIYNILAQSVGLLSTDNNPLFIGFLVEVVLLSSALILQYGEVQRERSRLKNELAEQQNKMFHQHIEGIEKERNRIAGDLHDSIGSKLGNLKRIYFDNESSTGAREITSLIDDVRHLSHDLAPTRARVSGLIPLVEKLIIETREASNVDIKLQTFEFRENLPTESIVQVYRIIQEALNNIVRHSGANHADIQFFGYDTQLVLTIEDDGIGFDPGAESGFGLNSLKARAALLEGKIEINSTFGKGCLIVVEIPIPSSGNS